LHLQVLVSYSLLGNYIMCRPESVIHKKGSPVRALSQPVLTYVAKLRDLVVEDDGHSREQMKSTSLRQDQAYCRHLNTCRQKPHTRPLEVRSPGPAFVTVGRLRTLRLHLSRASVRQLSLG
jgi:hypothetical protein